MRIEHRYGKEKLQKISKKLEIINSDLRKQFNHEKIFSDIGWGTSEGSNYVEVTFYEFNMDSKKHSELKTLSNKVIERLVFKNPKFKELSEDEKLNLIYKEIQEIKKYIENHEKEIYRASLKAFADNPELVRAILESKNNVELIKKES